MAFNSSGESNGTITMGNADHLKGESDSPNTIQCDATVTHSVTSGQHLGSGVPSKKQRHDDEEQGKLFVGGLR